MAAIQQEIEIDTLTHLEDRVQKAVALVQRLRQEKDAVLRDLAATKTSLEDVQTANMVLTDELEALKTERSQVRERLEKLLGHIDQLGAA
jgi:FtsZ-binding cell division protein ZapB